MSYCSLTPRRSKERRGGGTREKCGASAGTRLCKPGRVTDFVAEGSRENGNKSSNTRGRTAKMRTGTAKFWRERESRKATAWEGAQAGATSHPAEH